MTVLTAILLTSAVVQAQPGPNSRERVEDRRELHQDRHEARDDIRDLRALEGLLAEFDAARARHDRRTLARIDERLRRQIRAELAEGRRELRDDRREVARDRQEVRSDRRELRHDEHGSHAAADDRRDLRDDKRDLRDDQRDAAQERAALERTHQLLRELDALHGRFRPQSLERKRALIGELIHLARREVRQDKQELREDRHELREDRRETREDRRQR
ncbi:MAG: hypothetical protein HY901_20025 [Deltaproteobacteria bacterium]|nr:hypothetical protein [Deltaproteobacteria bacterium]